MRRWARARGRLARFVAEIYMIDAKITRKWFAAGVDERCICVFGHQNARWYGDAFFLKHKWGLCSKFKRGKHRQIGFFYNARIYALEMPKFTMDFSNEFFPPRLYLF